LRHSRTLAQANRLLPSRQSGHAAGGAPTVLRVDAFDRSSFPEDWELVSLFGIEPRVEFGNIDWFHDDLTFISERGSDRIECYLEMNEGRLDFTWTRDDAIVALKLVAIERLKVISQDNVEGLRVEFRSLIEGVAPLMIQLKPSIRIDWGTTHFE
jgi:hypothetical protein